MNTATPEDAGKALKAKTVTNGKVTEWEFGEVSGGTDEGIYAESITEYIPNWISHGTKKIDADGTVSDGASDQLIVLEVPIDGDFKFRLAADSYGGAANAKYAFYNADTYEDCGPSTLISSVKSYNRGTIIYDYEIPENTKILLICEKILTFLSCVKVSRNIRGYASIADEYSTEKTYSIGDYVNYNGLMYICITDISLPEEWVDSHWIATTVMKQIKKQNSTMIDFSESTPYQVGVINSTSGEIEAVNASSKNRIVTKNIIHIEDETILTVAEGYEANVFFYQSDGTYTGMHHGITSSYFYNVIPANSYIRYHIRHLNSQTVLTNLDIPEYVDKITYKSNLAKMAEQVENNKYSVSNGIAARMYEKGAAPKSFTQTPCILIAGQSNIAGVIPNSEIPSYITFPMTHIMYSPTNKPSTFDNGISGFGNWGVDLPLYKALDDVGNTAYIIKHAQTGTGIDLECALANKWTPYYEKLPNLQNSLLYTLETKIRTLGTANPNAYDIRALVWHQGEADSPNATSGNPYIRHRYYENFKCVLSYIRGVIRNERLPIIYGTISHNSRSYDQIIEAAQLRIAEEDPNCYCIDMSGASLIDDYHFNPDSAVYFGKMAFDALVDFGIITANKLNPTRPW